MDKPTHLTFGKGKLIMIDLWISEAWAKKKILIGDSKAVQKLTWEKIDGSRKFLASHIDRKSTSKEDESRCKMGVSQILFHSIYDLLKITILHFCMKRVSQLDAPTVIKNLQRPLKAYCKKKLAYISTRMILQN